MGFCIMNTKYNYASLYGELSHLPTFSAQFHFDHDNDRHYIFFIQEYISNKLSKCKYFVCFYATTELSVTVTTYSNFETWL